jgi:hypothetical protein
LLPDILLQRVQSLEIGITEHDRNVVVPKHQAVGREKTPPPVNLY